MKNTVPKNDKKRRKQLLEDVAKLEAELEEKHRGELKHLKETLPEQNKEHSAAINIARLELEDTAQIQPPRISKAQKRRLRALSHVLQTPIEVVQMDSPPIIVGEEYSGEPLTLVYMRHAYGLGEHYNSVKPLLDKTTENES
ncbi:hypothetical protein JD844_015983 [Phrynosoma platyrhinos]|uniref:OTU domain-containing protein n=1 Tax=Phrynosoma platyrhinos TaxID=52577 RepID=A0ABQ7SJT7_PHRPL|nr:hypothetical protein JD844_015983 [Phrynosoma platyrhinos]